jgi:hypothetical protein
MGAGQMILLPPVLARGLAGGSLSRSRAARRVAVCLDSEGPGRKLPGLPPAGIGPVSRRGFSATRQRGYTAVAVLAANLSSDRQHNAALRNWHSRAAMAERLF